ncbi:RING/U-box protein, putative [Medicago truncatula]|uniref:RING-type E3 ubiquitin transferase n=1 Tax=Medicago truncatula TaxID=3880 RepID=G7L439_MEDTR|nr:RING/U-box protein, putative [Medicago truncatula]
MTAIFDMAFTKDKSYMGYPGFKLSCTDDSKTVLTLPYSGVFNVRKIDYLEQTPHTIAQLRSQDHNLLAIPSLSFTNSLPQSCYVIKKLSVPIANSYPEFFLDNLSEDLELTWSLPDCRYCE